VGIKIGNRAPEFILLDTERKERSLKEFLGQKIVLAFFPGAFTGVCTKEICTFRDSLNELKELKTQIVAISVDSPFANKGFTETNKITFPVLSDYRREIIKKYDISLEDFAGMKGYTAAKRSVFILDNDGIIKYSWISDNPGVEPNYKEVKEALSKF
jgi:peroxiredoxin